MHLLTPIPAAFARPLIEGLCNDAIVCDLRARQGFATIAPVG